MAEQGVVWIVENNNLPLLSQLDPLMRRRIEVTMKQAGEIMKRGAVLAIQNQIAPDGTTWAALAEWYKQRKIKEGYSEQIYIMSSTYVNAITSKFTSNKELISLEVGVLRNIETVTGADMGDIAMLLEYGWEQYNTKIPPRPLWRPLLEVNRHSILTRIGVAIYWANKQIVAQAKGKIENV